MDSGKKSGGGRSGKIQTQYELLILCCANVLVLTTVP